MVGLFTSYWQRETELICVSEELGRHALYSCQREVEFFRQLLISFLQPFIENECSHPCILACKVINGNVFYPSETSRVPSFACYHYFFLTSHVCIAHNCYYLQILEPLMLSSRKTYLCSGIVRKCRPFSPAYKYIGS